MIRGVMYSKGRLKSIQFKDFKISKGYTWLHVSEPSLKELKEIANKTKIPLFELKHSIDPRERPRVVNRNNYTMVIFRALLSKEVGKRATFPVEFIATKNYLITLTAEKSEALESLFLDLDATVWKEVSKNGFSSIIFRVLLKVVRDYEKYLEDVDDIIDSLEEISLEARDKDLHSLLVLKRKLVFLRRSLMANKEVFNEINSNNLGFIKINDTYRELYTEYGQVTNTEELIKDRVTGVMEMFLSSASNNLNRVMKSFTVIASILLLPMLISSIYGMNLILPLGEHPFGFLIISGVMVLSIFTMLLFFSSKKWL